MQIIETTMVDELPAAPSRVGQRSGKYVRVLRQAIQHPDKWFRLDPVSIAGKIPQWKQNSLHTSAARQGIRINTCFREGFMYLKYAGVAADDVLKNQCSQENELRDLG